ncbi:protein TIFY 3-like isoform X2 [Phalaenopsis equestris]|uniref:protein TIFY 3-like isoform X2 n=1 Tax=Phalaenopsis equestris TaxID=78828 RepID=UPI0009E6053D|nr:protein TIFY 3-like isoform X2 [Phalaenopsis equestris]
MNHTVGAQLTIFYNGLVFSYDGITPKQAIILMAAAGASGKEGVSPALRRPQLLQLMPTAAESLQSAQLPTKPNFISALPDGGQGCLRRPPIRQVLREVPLGREHLPPLGRLCSLPLARANSIKRFLEARQKRLKSKAASDSERKVDDVKANLDAKQEEWLSLR